MKTFKLENKPQIETGFKVPENYFENFSARVTPQLLKEEPKIVPLYAKRKKWILAVAAIFILGMSIPFYNYFQNPYSELNQSSVEDYVIYNSSITDADLISLLDENDIKKINAPIAVDDNTIENELIKNSELEEYIIN